MTDPSVANIALTRAWSAYLLIHSGIDENDDRREALEQFIRKRCSAGVTDVELLAVDGLKYLKRLHERGA